MCPSWCGYLALQLPRTRPAHRWHPRTPYRMIIIVQNSYTYGLAFCGDSNRLGWSLTVQREGRPHDSKHVEILPLEMTRTEMRSISYNWHLDRPTVCALSHLFILGRRRCARLSWVIAPNISRTQSYHLNSSSNGFSWYSGAIMAAIACPHSPSATDNHLQSRR